MNNFVLLDDHLARSFEPFALTRPVGELRAGGLLIRERWQRVLEGQCIGFVSGAHLGSFQEFDSPPSIQGTIPAGTILVNSRCAPAIGLSSPISHLQSASSSPSHLPSVPSSPSHLPSVPSPTSHLPPAIWLCNGRVAAARLTAPLDISQLSADGAAVHLVLEKARQQGAQEHTIDGWWLDGVWDLIGNLNEMLDADARALMPQSDHHVPGHVSVIGSNPIHVETGATIEPMVVIDASAGPVLICKGAAVHAFTKISGPCIVGEGATVAGGRIGSCSIGERSKVHGELNSTIFIGHANKGHDGFVGHSVVGRWANLGAGTITSNLKNSYGNVALWTPSGIRRTGLQFLGAMIGDHAKTGIGTRLTTGCVVGAGASVFGTAMPPKVVPPFAWGEGPEWGTFQLDQFLIVAQRVMARRGVELSDNMRAALTESHARRWKA